MMIYMKSCTLNECTVEHGVGIRIQKRSEVYLAVTSAATFNTDSAIILPTFHGKSIARCLKAKCSNIYQSLFGIDRATELKRVRNQGNSNVH